WSEFFGRPKMLRLVLASVVATLAPFAFASMVLGAQPEAVSDTEPLTLEGDITSHLVDGVDRFLLRELQQSGDRRAGQWKRDFSSIDAYVKSIDPHRERLAHILGVRDPRVAFDAPELVSTTAPGASL